MSLINDALKRAKEVHEQLPPPAPSHFPPLRPAEPAQAGVRRGLGFALPVAFGIVALLALFFVWRFAQDRGKGQQTEMAVHASTGMPSKVTAPAPELPKPIAPPQPATNAVVAITAPAPAPAVPTPAPAPTVPAPAAPPPAVSQPGPVAVSTAPVSNTVAVPVAPSPQPPPLKLLGVVYSPTRPSAVLSGKVVFLGDRVQGFRVTAISPDSVTLVGNGKTNRLTLPE